MGIATISKDNSYLLNLLSVTFSMNEVNGETLTYLNSDHLRQLQDDNVGRWIVRRSKKYIQAAPLAEDVTTLSGTPATFSTSTDWSLFERLLDESVRRFLTASFPSCVVSNYGAVLLKRTDDKTSMVKEALKDTPHLLAPLSAFKIFRTYHFEAAHLRSSQNDPLSFGLRIRPSTIWEFEIPVTQLGEMGLALKGCYVVPLVGTSTNIGGKTAGFIREVKDGKIYLGDARDAEVVDAQLYTIEANSENVTRYLSLTLGTKAGIALKAIRYEVGKFLGAVGQQERIVKIAEALAKQPIVCARDLTATINNRLQKTAQSGSCQSAKVNPPKYVLRFGAAPINGPIATALDAQGPFDQDAFKKPIPSILIITPKQWAGQVDQFVGRWLEGGLPRPYAKGFLQKYKLRKYEKHFEDFEESEGSPATNYEQACLKALQISRDRIQRFDLAIVATSEKHQLLGANDPYLVAKATLMSQGIPVQAIEIETINLPVGNWPFVLNNFALACYAKMGGTPWVLASPKGSGVTHEVVIGLGSATLPHERLGAQERHVGIATLFNYDGVYLLSKTTKESSYDNYRATLEAALISCLNDVSGRKGWRPDDKVRLIFHTFKPLKNTEIEAVKALVTRHLAHFKIDFAFLEIGNEHNWLVYDPDSPGHQPSKGDIRGVQVPGRGSAVFLNEREALLCVTGPMELKYASQGTPAPLRIVLNGASTFTDLRYLTEQIFNFTYMSWKTFNLSASPVTIEYSDRIAQLLGRLRHVKNWNANALETTELSNSLWFL